MRARQDGMALLAVLLLVATIAVLITALLDDIRFAQRRTGNLQAIEQAQRYALGTEALARQRLTQLAGLSGTAAVTAAASLDGRPLVYPIDNGMLRVQLRDASACFNLNGVVQGGLGMFSRSELGARQYSALLQATGIEQARAEALTDTLVDWIDSDQQPGAQGAEDDAYAGGEAPYRTGDTLLAEVSELRALRGYDADVYARIRPFVCALPSIERGINTNSLRPDDAPVLVALTAGLVPLASARRIIVARPPTGWTQDNSIWGDPAMAAAGAELGDEVYQQADTRSTRFTLRSEVDHAGAQAVLTALLDLDGTGRPRTVARRWTLDE